MNTENITRVRRLDLNTVLYSGSAYQSQGSSAAGHWINTNIHFFPNASSEWNKLPEQIVNSSSVILFKTNLQKYMLENHDSNCKICYNL